VFHTLLQTNLGNEPLSVQMHILRSVLHMKNLKVLLKLYPEKI